MIRRGWGLWLAGLTALLIASWIISCSMGPARIGPIRTAEIILSKLLPIRRDWSESEEVIILSVRLPRATMGCVVGMGLAIAGCAFQALLRNPLAGPFVLGVSSGGSLGAVIAIVIGAEVVGGVSTLPLFAFIGSLLTMFLVYSIARKDGRLPVHTLILAGVIVNSLFSALITLLISLVRSSDLHRFIIWAMGDLSVVERSLLFSVPVIIILGSAAIYLNAYRLNLISLGEEEAAHLGVEVERAKRVVFILASLVTGATVSACGVIGFVGLVVPHMMRMVVGPDHRILIAASALAGGAFLMLADAISRVIVVPAELPVGVITAICGAPFFIYLLKTREGRFFR